SFWEGKQTGSVVINLPSGSWSTTNTTQCSSGATLKVGADTWLRQSDKQGRDQEARPCGHDNSFIDSHRQICLSRRSSSFRRSSAPWTKLNETGEGRPASFLHRWWPALLLINPEAFVGSVGRNAGRPPILISVEHRE